MPHFRVFIVPNFLFFFAFFQHMQSAIWYTGETFHIQKEIRRNMRAKFKMILHFLAERGKTCSRLIPSDFSVSKIVLRK